VYYNPLINSTGATAEYILRMLPKLKKLCRADNMSVNELSAVSKDLVSLKFLNGLDAVTAQVDMPLLVFPRLEKVEVETENDLDLLFIATVLENSIPQGRGFLKKLYLNYLPLQPYYLFVEYARLNMSLIKIIEVWI
jgi:hypothetical protein